MRGVNSEVTGGWLLKYTILFDLEFLNSRQFSLSYQLGRPQSSFFLCTQNLIYNPLTCFYGKIKDVLEDHIDQIDTQEPCPLPLFEGIVFIHENEKTK